MEQIAKFPPNPKPKRQFGLKPNRYFPIHITDTHCGADIEINRIRNRASASTVVSIAYGGVKWRVYDIWYIYGVLFVHAMTMWISYVTLTFELNPIVTFAIATGQFATSLGDSRVLGWVLLDPVNQRDIRIHNRFQFGILALDARHCPTECSL